MAEGYRIYRYDAESQFYQPEGETAGTNYIVYDLIPGRSYEFRVTALWRTEEQTQESEPSETVCGTAGSDVLDNVAAAAPIPMFTVIDDDTRDPYSVKLFHDVCVANGVRGCYAVVTSNFSMAGTDGYSSLLDQLKAYEADGFDMLLHARDHDARFLRKSRNNGWNGHLADETVLLAEQSIQGGLADMQATGLGHPVFWVAPMGVHDEEIRNIARNAGVECLLGVANKAYVSKTPTADGWNRWCIPRVELYGTDGAFDANRSNYQTGRHNSDRIWNTSDDVKTQIDAAAADNAWVIICTHVYESEWYLPRVTLTKNGDSYTASAFGDGLSAEWREGAVSVPLIQTQYTFVYDKRNGVVGWFFEEGTEPQSLACYGIVLTGNPVYQAADPDAASPDRSDFYMGRFSEIMDYAKGKGLTNVTFSEGYARWEEIYDAQERADACHILTFEEGNAPTCSAAGRRSCYACSICGGRFADEGAHTLLSETELILPVESGGHMDLDDNGCCDFCGKKVDEI